LPQNSKIFYKFINNKYRLVPFTKLVNSIGKPKYSPAISKEWNNSVYYYNNNNMKNLPSYDINLNSIIKGYFNSYFNDKILMRKKAIPRRLRRLSFTKIFLSKAEIKHTNSTAVVTIYTYNRERIALKKIIKKLKKSFFSKILFIIKKSNNLYKNITNNKYIKHDLNQEMILIRRYKLRLNLNKYKFQEFLLSRLANIIGRIYNKEVKFNIVNIKSIILNTDIFTTILALKLKKRNTTVLRAMYRILDKARFPITNNIIERSRIMKNVDLNQIDNKYKSLNLSFILKKYGIDNVLNRFYVNVFEKNYKQLYDTIFNDIKYKNMSGIRLEIKGRLTKRYRADRAVYKVKWRGGLKNIDSSFKGLSSVNFRGYSNSNVDYSIRTSKRRIGAFAVKGWISGK